MDLANYSAAFFHLYFGFQNLWSNSQNKRLIIRLLIWANLWLWKWTKKFSFCEKIWWFFERAFSKHNSNKSALFSWDWCRENWLSSSCALKTWGIKVFLNRHEKSQKFWANWPWKKWLWNSFEKRRGFEEIHEGHLVYRNSYIEH